MIIQMRFVFLLQFIFLFICAKAQIKQAIDIPVTINYDQKKDTSLWFKWKTELAKELQLEDLLESTDSFHLRFWTNLQALDIWSADNLSYKSVITNFAEQLKEGSNVTEKVYHDQIRLEQVQTAEIIHRINELQITSVPSDQKIKGWPQNGLDGYEYCVEISTANSYSFKTYWSPSSLTALPEAKRIQDFADFLFSKIRMADWYKKLKLPAGSRFRRNGIPGMNIEITNPYPPTNRSVLETLQ